MYDITNPILNLISESLNKKSWLKIIECSLENDQIYNSNGVIDALYNLIKKENVKLKSILKQQGIALKLFFDSQYIPE